MRLDRAVFSLLLLLLPLGAAVMPARAGSPAEDRARAVVERLHRALGGADAPYRVGSIAFRFAVEKDGQVVNSRSHVWRPGSGDHKVEGTTKEGKPFVIVWNLHSKAGKATLAGAALEGEALKAELERAWAFWVNDTFWLLMPYKLRDPGVILAHDGEKVIDGRAYDLIKVTFDKVGLTPGDTYWAYVARDSGLMERWSFVLQGQQPPPVEFRWLETGRFGPLVLSRRKEKVGAAQAILTDRIEVR